MNMNAGIRRLVIPGDGYVGLRDWKYKDNDSTYYNYDRDMQCSIEIGSYEDADRELAELVAARSR